MAEIRECFDENLEYNCPKFVDFTATPGLPDDDYFSYDHENGCKPVALNFEEFDETIKSTNICDNNNASNISHSLSVINGNSNAILDKKSRPRSNPRAKLAASRLIRNTLLAHSPIYSGSPIPKRRCTRSSNPDKTNSSSLPSTPGRVMTRAFKRQLSAETLVATQYQKKFKKPTEAVTPRVLKHKPIVKNGPNQVKSREEMEIETIQKLQEELKQKRRIAESSRRVALAAKASKPVSLKHHTMPEEFHFATDNRVKQNNKNESEQQSQDFAHSLRHYQSQPKGSKGVGITLVKPFNLHQSRPQEISENAESYVSMAQAVTEFSKKTPARFRRSKRNRSKDRTATSKFVPHHTRAKTPCLKTRQRARPKHIVSQAELDDREIEEMKQSQFKAHPFNEKIFDKPIGIKKVAAKPPTIAEEFGITSAHPAAHEEKENTEIFHFRAKPVPKNILKKVVGVKPMSAAAVTVAQSPAFALKNRVKQRPEPEPQQRERYVLRSNPIPHSGVPFQPQLTRKHTEMVPFSFEERDAYKKVNKEIKQKEQEELERKAHEFHAQGMPDFRALNQQRHQYVHKAFTKTKPFHLESDDRGEKKLQQWKNQVEKEIREEKKKANFKAHPCNVLQQEPFIPAKSDRPSTEVSDFTLNTELRSNERAKFDACICEKQLIDEQRIAEKKREQELEEQKLVTEQRKNAVHKPGPIRHYKPLVIKKSDKAITEPHTPRFSARLNKLDRH